MKTIQLNIEGMSCGHCKKHVEEAFASEAGVSQVEVSLENASATVTFDEELTDEKTIKSVLDSTTYSVV